MRWLAALAVLRLAGAFSAPGRNVARRDATVAAAMRPVAAPRKTRGSGAIRSPPTAAPLTRSSAARGEAQEAPVVEPETNGVEPETLLIIVVYFLQGALGLSRLALTFYLKDDLGLSPAEVGAL
jgi:hypothetical protein